MRLIKARKLKLWRYSYRDVNEMNEHKAIMLAAKFNIEKQGKLFIEFSQIINETD